MCSVYTYVHILVYVSYINCNHQLQQCFDPIWNLRNHRSNTRKSYGEGQWVVREDSYFDEWVESAKPICARQIFSAQYLQRRTGLRFFKRSELYSNRKFAQKFR